MGTWGRGQEAGEHREHSRRGAKSREDEDAARRFNPGIVPRASKVK